MTAAQAPRRFRVEFRYTRLVHIRWFLSGPTVLGLTSMFTSLLLRGPASSVMGPSVVSALADRGPVWPVVFGVALAAMLAALTAIRAIGGAHVVAGCAVVFYGAALLYSEIVLQGIGWGVGGFLLAAGLWQFVLAAIYAQGRGDYT